MTIIDETPDRKPDLEMESFRAWVATDKEKKEAEKDAENHPIIIEEGDMKMQVTGFNKAIDEKTDKVIFGYKFKHKDKLILYYIADDITPENQKKVKTFLDTVHGLCPSMDYELKDIRRWVKNIMLNKHLLDDIGTKKDEAKK